MIKEFWYLVKLLFTKQSNQLEVVKMKHFPFKGYSAMSWCGKIITRKDNIGTTTRNHERIHLEQALFFNNWIHYYIIYLWYWIIGLPIIYPFRSAYYTIPFEVEAYANEYIYDYHPTKNSWKKYKIKNRKKTFRKNKNNWKSFCKSL